MTTPEAAAHQERTRQVTSR